MSKRKKKIKGCTGKKKYPSKEAAQGALFGMLRRQKKKGINRVAQFNIYGCRCGSFHIGKGRGIVWSKVNM